MNKQGRGKIPTALAGLILLGGSPLAAAEQWVVIAAEQTSLQPGALLEGKRSIRLAEGAQLTLLAENGKVLKLTGPYAGIPGDDSKGKAQKTDNLTAIASLLQGHRQFASTLGAMRAPDSQPASADLTADLIDVDRSGERCLSGDPVVLWRDNTTKSERIVLADAQGAPLATFSWPAHEARLPVPGHYFEDGKRYLLQRADKLVSLRVHKVATLPGNPAALAAWMAKNGCQIQALNVLSGL